MRVGINYILLYKSHNKCQIVGNAIVACVCSKERFMGFKPPPLIK